MVLPHQRTDELEDLGTKRLCLTNSLGLRNAFFFYYFRVLFPLLFPRAVVLLPHIVPA